MLHRYSFNKLVRSKLFEKEVNGEKRIASYKILGQEEYKKELLNKFHEEAMEVIEAKDRGELIAEIADCYEVIDEILKANNIAKDDVILAQTKKREQKGSFDKRIFVNYMQYDDKNPLHKEAFDYIRDKNQNEKYKLIGSYEKHIIDFIITNEKGQIYIQKRSASRKSYPNCWELPGGTLEIDENFRQLIKRELKEELNLELVKINEIVFDGDCVINGEKCAYTVFSIQVSGWENFKLEEGKADEFKWISRKEIQILNVAREDGKINPVYEAARHFFEKLLD
ncbi:NUDIX domain-containing protein [Candidatus Deianiraea vastatrix]|uniref:8-oxo-dGTP diphosphatase n=1 Tax=Candidatus Deianiraea vastatrix TaxID=2163644 RepID=A0A5B8XFR5_9RICK|nr:NUDIX domain-containing protein [Candidatus Deianiraea vastatrix]QED23745.1 Putative Nudix hydrolase [Candidatus Deianiraea vastatrix]